MDKAYDISFMKDYQRRLQILLDRMDLLHQKVLLLKQSFCKDNDKSVDNSVEDPQLEENIDEEESEQNEEEKSEDIDAEENEEKDDDDDDGWIIDYE